MSTVHLTCRVTPAQAEKLDVLAERAGLSRSQLLRRLVDEATGDVSATARRLSAEEALDLLHEQARGGRVSALIEVLRRYRDEDPRQRAFAALEQLAAERKQ